MMLGFSDGTPLLECKPLPTMTLSCRPFRLSTSQKAGLASAPFQHHAKFIRTFLGPLDGLFPAQSVHVYRVGLKVSCPMVMRWALSQTYSMPPHIRLRTMEISPFCLRVKLLRCLPRRLCLPTQNECLARLILPVRGSRTILQLPRLIVLRARFLP